MLSRINLQDELNKNEFRALLDRFLAQVRADYGHPVGTEWLDDDGNIVVQWGSDDSETKTSEEDGNGTMGDETF